MKVLGRAIAALGVAAAVGALVLTVERPAPVRDDAAICPASNPLEIGTDAIVPNPVGCGSYTLNLVKVWNATAASDQDVTLTAAWLLPSGTATLGSTTLPIITNIGNVTLSAASVPGTTASWACGATPTGTGTALVVTPTPTNGAAITCTITYVDSAADVSVDKSVVSLSDVDLTTGTHTLVYQIDVTNSGGTSTTYNLMDTPGFATPSQIVTLSARRSTDSTSTALTAAIDVYTVASDVTLPGLTTHTYFVTVVAYAFTLDSASTDAACNGTTKHGFYNLAQAYHADTLLDSDSACIDLPMPVMSLDKSITGLDYPATDQITVHYAVTASSELLDTVNGLGAFYIYDISLNWFGLTGVGSAVTRTVTGPELTEINLPPILEINSPPTQGFTTIAIVAPGGTVTYDYSITYTVDLEGGFDGECRDFPADATSLDPDWSFGGAQNFLFSLLSSKSQPFTITDQVCTPLSAVTLHKKVTNENGGELQADDVLLTLTDDDGNVQSGHDGETVVVASGDYTGGEDEHPGYVAGAMSCTLLSDGVDDGDPTIGDIINGSAVRLADDGPAPLTFLPDHTYDCTLTNTDSPVDLQVTKTDDGGDLVAGGDFITYTIEVSNVGDRPLDAGDDVTVTDTLPDGATVVDGSITGCDDPEVVGQVLTCTVPADAVNDGTVTITLDMTMPADADSGTLTNQVVVGNIDDPAPEQSCLTLNLESADPQSNNLACETTPLGRDADISITKVSDATGPKQVGDTITYTLTVTPEGPSTMRGITVTDALPAGLAFVSAEGEGWACIQANPIVCTLDDEVQPGALPVIRVVTKVTATEAGTITNTATVVGVVDTTEDGDQLVDDTATADASADVQVLASEGTLPETGSSPWSLLYVALASLGAGAYLLRLRRLRLG